MEVVWLVAAENGALPGGKIGGVGDVVRDLPAALADAGLDVSVVTPSYGMFHKLPGAEFHREVQASFGGQQHVAEVYRVPVAGSAVEHLVVEHPLLSPAGPGRVYVADGSGGPYAVDAAKFAFFNAVLAAWVNDSGRPPDVLHLNDWHTGLIPALRRFGGDNAPLAGVRTVFTIHNLAYQGIRPFRGQVSSLESWFPELLAHTRQLSDPRYQDCVNFMASAIRLCDAINTVSPNYAQEIQRPNDPARGFSGGEGLEGELGEAHAAGRLTGILNGCTYPPDTAPPPAWDELLQVIAGMPDIFNANQGVEAWMSAYKGRRPRHLLLSIGRVVDQKVPLFLEPVPGYDTALEAILGQAGRDALFIMLGSGDEALERRFADLSRVLDNFLYLRGYAESLTDPLYAIADLFLMPSSFEPCGISQMLAMRAGQPCVVHAVGGLADTVRDGRTGFVFKGETPAEQAENFVSSVLKALSIRQHKPAAWERIRSNAAAERFSWEVAAAAYLEELYRDD